MQLSIETLCAEAARFSAAESRHPEASLFGVTDGKAVGTYLEHKFRAFLRDQGYQFEEGNSANGIDFPCLLVDMKVTSIRQPQSSCPFRSARQKVYGLGYSLIIFVYGKTDDEATRTSNLNIADAIFVEAEHTADFQMSKGLRDILENEGNRDDLVAFLSEKNLPVDDIGLDSLVTEILQNTPKQGYLTISNALQWRLQYSRVIEKAGNIEGVRAVYRRQAA
ncbi:MAG: restriction endonuclease [Thiothrix lacustris]|uniref:Restriction endonuclease n=1 Tax=Thiothrix lacustris TaxID=525917 RepID=A0A1Y1QLV7_9GAMM|nr:MAG: restriction endonuclease [Thiothrix lacustris]